MLGGCSSINAMAYVRGDPSNFACWPSGWQYEDVLPYFRRSEALRRDAAAAHHAVDEKYRSRDGPMTVTHQEMASPSPWSRRFVEAAVATGFQLLDDYNGASQVRARAIIGVQKRLYRVCLGECRPECLWLNRW